MTAAWIAESLLLSFLLCISSASPADQINITAVIGENKILPCRAENGSIKHVAWKRTDIKEGNVLGYRNDAVDTGDQHPSFKHRVFFQDREMKDGDVSLVLINVRMNDSGTYEAEVAYKETDSKGNLICSIHLNVAPPPPPPGSFPSWAKALLFLLGLILIGILLYSNRRLCPKPGVPLRDMKNVSRFSQDPQVESGEKYVLQPLGVTLEQRRRQQEYPRIKS